MVNNAFCYGIESEFILGKYNESGNKKREEQLLDWLTERGF
ncbi:MAG TPA: hypothetical protein PK033_10495 [Acetivibrio sp.]|jgi:hypothetical protein|nr:hypothetical protein [Acetivibrio sp.]HPT91254.1 hypothetical protein [Acetivibrio sp.]HQA58288.1 hypothetical protein [Acetivibrio sp.]